MWLYVAVPDLMGLHANCCQGSHHICCFNNHNLWIAIDCELDKFLRHRRFGLLIYSTLQRLSDANRISFLSFLKNLFSCCLQAFYTCDLFWVVIQYVYTLWQPLPELLLAVSRWATSIHCQLAKCMQAFPPPVFYQLLPAGGASTLPHPGHSAQWVRPL